MNLNLLGDILKRLLSTLGTNNSQKQESSTSNQNSNNKSVNINGNGNTVDNGINNNIFIENLIINDSNISVNLIETNKPAVIKKVWSSIKKDLPIKVGPSDNLWLCAGKDKDGKIYINIGKYYSCEVNEKEIVFWLGAEAMDNEAYVQLYINEDQLKQQELMKPSKTICGKSSIDGSFRPHIDKFSSDASQEDLETALDDALRAFLQDIFNGS